MSEDRTASDDENDRVASEAEQEAVEPAPQPDPAPLGDNSEKLVSTPYYKALKTRISFENVDTNGEPVRAFRSLYYVALTVLGPSPERDCQFP